MLINWTARKLHCSINKDFRRTEVWISSCQLDTKGHDGDYIGLCPAWIQLCLTIYILWYPYFEDGDQQWSEHNGVGFLATPKDTNMFFYRKHAPKQPQEIIEERAAHADAAAGSSLKHLPSLHVLLSLLKYLVPIAEKNCWLSPPTASVEKVDSLHVWCLELKRSQRLMDGVGWCQSMLLSPLNTNYDSYHIPPPRLNNHIKFSRAWSSIELDSPVSLWKCRHLFHRSSRSAALGSTSNCSDSKMQYVAMIKKVRTY